ncbi:MAG TPA: hypothetical protein VIK59_10240 [Verrucomicrobiae bacterium]
MSAEKLEIYEKLWMDATCAFKRGEPQIDPHLSDKKNDLRRGVTVILRPSLPVRNKIKEFSTRLAAICPEQYFYRPPEFHVTVLSIISGTEFWRREIGRLNSYREIIGDILSRQRAFKIHFQGVTASPGSVMIQGFPMDDALAKIRAEIREAFARRGFGGTLDRRYKISAAHITLMRFGEPVSGWKRLTRFLKENRRTHFGETQVNRLQLIWGDWYASANRVRKLQDYPLIRVFPSR